MNGLARSDKEPTWITLLRVAGRCHQRQAGGPHSEHRDPADHPGRNLPTDCHMPSLVKHTARLPLESSRPCA